MSDSIRQKFGDHYRPKVEAFPRETQDLDAQGIPAVHLPLWGKHYAIAKRKAAFIGIDTSEWGEMAEFLKKSPEEALWYGESVRFFEEKTFREFGFLGCTNRGKTSFWDTVLKFLAKFNNIPNWHELRNNQRLYEDILSGFVWAEANAVELWQHTPSSQNADFASWEKFKTAAETHFDYLSSILEVFRPHAVIILNGDQLDDTNKRVPYWGGCNFEQCENLSQDVWYGLVPEYGTHVFWTYHPRALGTRIDEVLETVVQKWSGVCS